jgi:hypothetical protein
LRSVVEEVVSVVSWRYERVRQRRAVDARSDLKLIQRHQVHVITLGDVR